MINNGFPVRCGIDICLYTPSEMSVRTRNINLYKRTSINLKSDIDTLNPAYTQLLKYLKKIDIDKYIIMTVPFMIRQIDV